MDGSQLKKQLTSKDSGSRFVPLSFPFTTYDPPGTPGPDLIGVYELGWPAPTDSGYAVVYIGSGRIRQRLQEHNRSNKSWVAYRCEITNSTRRARQRERREQRRFRDFVGRLPKFNKQIG